MGGPTIWTSPLLDLLFEDPVVGRCLVAPDGSILRANSEWLRSAGFSPDDVFGVDIVELFPETGDMAKAMHTKARAGLRVEVPRHAQFAKGREWWWEERIEPVSVEGGGTGLLITTREVAPPLRDQDAQRARKDAPYDLAVLMEATFASMTQGVMVYGPDAKVLRINAAAERILGISQHEWLAADGAEARAALVKLKTPDGTPQTIEETPTWRALHGESSHDVEMLLFKKSGEATWISAGAAPIVGPNGEIVGAVATFSDVTEQKRAHEALRESEERFRALVAQAASAFFLHDFEGRFLDVNHRACESLGYTREELLRMRVPDVEEDFDLAAAQREWAKIQPGEPFTLFGHNRRKDGSVFPVEVRFACVEVKGERLFLGLSQDITERQRAEQALRGSEQRFRLALRNSPVSVAAQDCELRYIWAYNQRTTRSDELIGKLDTDIFTTEEAERLGVIKRRVLTQNVEHREQMWFDRPSGRIFLDVCFEPLHDEAGRVIGVGSATVDLTPMKLAEQALREREERLAVTLRSIGDAVIATDDLGRVTVFNGVAEKLTGFTCEDAVGRPVQEVFNVIAEDTRRPAVSPVERVLREGTVAGLANHTALIARDGTERPIADSGAPIRDATGRLSGVVLVFRDQTEERRAERALQESEAWFRTIFEQAAVGMARVDPSTGRILSINQKFCDIVGYSREEMLLRGWQDITHPADLQSDLESVARLQRGELSTFSKEKRYLHRNGSTVWVSVTVSRRPGAGEEPDFRIAAVEDITARKQAEESLRNSEKRFRALIENSTDMIVVLDEDMRVAFWSPSATEQLGWTAEEVKGRRGFELVHPDDRAQSKETFGGLSGRPGASVRFVRRQLHKDGSARLVEVTARNLLHDPAVGGVVANLRDISSQRQLEEQLRQSQKMEAIGHLAGGVAHDFNNILSVILSCAEFGRETLQAGDSLREEFLEIEKVGKRAAALTHQLLAFSRKQVLQPEALDLNRILLEMEGMLRRIIGEDIELVQVLSQDLWLVKADPGQIEQVILNLAVNARDAMSNGGRLTIETANAVLDGEYVEGHPDALPGPHVVVAVSDSGVGMDQATLARVFEPFFTTKGPGKGTGLGLSTVYGIVKQSGGTTYAYSEPGKGTVFKVYLPRELSLTPVVKGPPAGVLSGGAETILLVEDDEAVRNVAKRILSSGGYTVLTAASGAEALTACEQNPAVIHLVLTDVVMPEMSGRVFVDRLRKLRTGIKVLYMSGYTDNAIVHLGILDPGTRLVEKPLMRPELLKMVRRVLDEDG